MDDRLHVGFIGAGTIASSLIEGLNAGARRPSEIVLSPRNPDTAAALASRHPNVSIAGSNQEVLDRCRMVFLTVRPQVAEEVLGALRFGQDHHVVSCIAMFDMARLKGLIGGAPRMTRAAPLPLVSGHCGPTALFPPDETMIDIFDELGSAIPATSEEELDAFFVATASMGSYFGLLGTMIDWLEKSGVQPAAAKRFVAQMFAGLGAVALDQHHRDMGDLRAEFTTAGGLNQQFFDELNQAGVFIAMNRALDRVATRIRSAK